MDPHSFLYSAVLLLVVAAVSVTLFRHFGLGTILGLLVTGIIVGPHTPGPFVTTEVESVRQFTEIGVVMLLFLIGLEMKPKRLWSLRRMLFGLGSLQVILSAIAIAAYFRLHYANWQTPILLGASFALSSTAIVIQMLRDKGEVASEHGQAAFAVLLLQDLAVVPLLALIPVVAGNDAAASEPLGARLGMAVAMVLLVVGCGRYLVPRALDYLARQKHHEAFFLTALAAMFVASLAMDTVGMSMALGAFLMGMMLSTSRYSLQIEASMEPHKGLLMSLFFVAVGMSVDIHALAQHPLTFAGHIAAIVGIKVLILFGLCLAFGVSKASAKKVAFLLSQGGEFGFVIFGAAKALGAVDDTSFVMAIGVISVTMLLTPLLSKLGAWMAARERLASGMEPGDTQLISEIEKTAPRVVVAGYGRVGHTVGTILASSGIPYVAFDHDASLVDQWRSEGHPVFYGDVCNRELLRSAALQQVELVVLTIDNGNAAVRAATLIRSIAPHINIVARAGNLATCDALRRAGVTQAYPEALEASLRLAAHSLEALGITNDDTEMLLRGVRTSDYGIVREGPEALNKP